MHALVGVLVVIAALDLLGFRPLKGGPDRELRIGTVSHKEASPGVSHPYPGDIGASREYLPEDAGHESVKVEVLDAVSGEHIDGCRFVTAQGGKPVPSFFVSPGKYEVVVGVPSRREAIRVSIEGYDAGLISAEQLIEESTEAITIRLSPLGGTIRGRVTSASGEPLPDDVVVVGWRAGEAAPVLSRESKPRSSLHCSISETGDFVLTGVAPEKQYFLSAVGTSVICVTPASARAGDVVLLPMKPAFGAVIRYVDGEGGPIRTGSAVYYQTDGVTIRASAGTLPIDTPPSLWEWAGIAHSRQLRRDAGWEHSVLATVSDPGAVAQVTIRARIPGYRLREETIRLPRLDSGESSVVEVPLQPLVDEWADLEVIVRRPLDYSGIADSQATARGLVRMKPTGRAAETMEFWVSAAAQGRQIVCGVPVGDYDISFKSASKAVELPRDSKSWKFAVKDGADPLLIDLSSQGALVVKGVPETARPGWLILEPGSGAQATYYPLTSPNMLIDLVQHGDCHLAIALTRSDLVAAMSDAISGELGKMKRVHIESSAVTEVNFGVLWP